MFFQNATLSRIHWFIKFGLTAYGPLFAARRYRRLDRSGKLLTGRCHQIQIIDNFDPTLTLIISTGTGLLLLRNGYLYKLLSSMGYIFGSTIANGRFYFLHLIQFEGNYRHTEETFRRGEIYSVAISDILEINAGQRLHYRREYSEPDLLYAQCDSTGDHLYCVDYRGRLSKFPFAKNGSLDIAGAKHVMLNRAADGTPLVKYSYTHFNSISVKGDRVVIGAHCRKAWTGQFSKIYTIPATLDVDAIQIHQTRHIHAHDVTVARNTLFTNDSKNHRITVNKKPFFNLEDAMQPMYLRGLSVLKDRVLVGASLRSEDRKARNRERARINAICMLDNTGKIIQKVELNASQIYAILTLSERDYTISTFESMDYENEFDMDRILRG